MQSINQIIASNRRAIFFKIIVYFSIRQRVSGFDHQRDALYRVSKNSVEICRLSTLLLLTFPAPIIFPTPTAICTSVPAQSRWDDRRRAAVAQLVAFNADAELARSVIGGGRGGNGGC